MAAKSPSGQQAVRGGRQVSVADLCREVAHSRRRILADNIRRFGLDADAALAEEIDELARDTVELLAERAGIQLLYADVARLYAEAFADG